MLCKRIIDSSWNWEISRSTSRKDTDKWPSNKTRCLRICLWFVERQYNTIGPKYIAWTGSNELKRIREETAASWFEVLSQNIPDWGLRKTTKNLRKVFLSAEIQIRHLPWCYRVGQVVYISVCSTGNVNMLYRNYSLLSSAFSFLSCVLPCGLLVVIPECYFKRLYPFYPSVVYILICILSYFPMLYSTGHCKSCK